MTDRYCIRCGGVEELPETGITCAICVEAINTGSEPNGADRSPKAPRPAPKQTLSPEVVKLVKAARSVLSEGFPDDPEDNDLVRALQPYEALVPYVDTIEADISAALAAQGDDAQEPGHE